MSRTRSDEPGAWFAMLPLEMVYDYDPIPPQPDHCRQDPIPEDEEYRGTTFSNPLPISFRHFRIMEGGGL